MLTDLFPVYGLRVTTPRLELRLPTTAELVALGELAGEGVHDPSYMPFVVPWTVGTPTERARRTVQWHWGQLAAMTPEKWNLHFAVFLDGEVVGTQEISGKNFAVVREVATGSWLGLRHHGKGIGTEMRAAVLHLAFAGLDAVAATSAAFADNLPSQAVSRKLGYEADGISRGAIDGVLRTDQKFRLSRERWEKYRTVPVEIHGLGPCLADLGLA